MTTITVWADGQKGERWEIQHRYPKDAKELWTTTSLAAFGPRAARLVHDMGAGRNEFFSKEKGLDFLRRFADVVVGHKETEFRLVHVSWNVKVEPMPELTVSTGPICGAYVRERYGHGAIHCQKKIKHRGKHDDLGKYL